MDFSAPSPSSSSDSRSSYSPRLMSADLGLDPSDPLNLLLHNTSQSHSSANSSLEEPSREGGSPPDWSQLSSLWPDNDFGGQTKPYPDMMDFSELGSLSLDIDLSNAIAVEPSALHFNPIKYNTVNTHYPYSPPTDDLLSGHYPFTFQANSPSASDTSSQPSGRRLSITSSVSSSGASLSPAPESVPSPVTAKRTDFPSNATAEHLTAAAAELAERVRQSAGVMLALPMNAQLQQHENLQQTAQTAPATSPTTAPKLPIPRLPRHVSQSARSSSSTASSAASTPPPSTPSPPPTTAVPAPSASVVAPLPRPKTSHTTIERRYRTNLNARIQSLRMAVPALRVVEDRDTSKKRAPNKVLVSHDTLGGEQIVAANGVVDVIDERGFVDGVKVARKCSKANVLGKAVEYIRVLKKREGRLKAEQAGLKALVAGLVGGPALLREWEREWREKFGGEEKDEVEGEMEGEVDEDDSEEEQEDEEEGGRKRKRGKTTPAGAPPAKQEKREKKPVLGDGVVPEKRKRGRPRKVIAPVIPAPIPVQDQMMEQDGQGAQQYLLAVFAVFSFFNSPLTSSTSTPHVHTGTVLNGSAATADGGSWGFTEYMQMFHLLVSVVVLLSFVSSWTGFSFTSGKFVRSNSLLNYTRRSVKDKRTKGDWVRLGEECVLSASNEISLFSRLQIYHQISSWPGAGVQELTTAALALYGAGSVRIFGGLARAKARTVWDTAKSRSRAQALPGPSTYERMVLEEMTVDEAVVRLQGRSVQDESTGEAEKARTPVQLLAAALVRERIRAHLGVLFAASVNSRAGDEGGELDKEALEREDVERQRTIEAAKELGGHVGELGRRLERVWKVPGDCLRNDLDVGSEEGEGDLEALLAALVLYRRVFASPGNGASALMSPPPSPGRKDTSDAGMLRRALGSRLFEESAALEDARDRAVDMVVALERKNVGLN
ncbi:putative helix loop helix domain containing protein [Lyophyllum shimeji]|uniref:Helix loop helix domain containing protein n=1 Tax=Lyophyllum shimeji TaxID=47721 RepID=A0A9P3ULC5_LYOSH|nr:putative helix loop helix domain containing protein [Lyophyllum shimeji]